MATARNVFVKSKMNKDLDDRLISKGEYRDAQNVNISRSEGDDVGAIENVLGNELLSDFSLSGDTDLEVIGKFEDISNNIIYVFATDYTDTSDSKIDNFAPFGSKCAIFSYNLNSPTSIALETLVEGRFLNFSKRSLITGVDLIEDLLFFTDNRNQPRKINVKKAATSSTYYTTEDQISVTKYNPYQPPQLYKSFTITILSSSGTSGYETYTVSDNDGNKLRSGQYLKIAPANGIAYRISASGSNSFKLNQQLSPALTGTVEIYEANSKNVTDRYMSPTVWANFNSPVLSNGTLNIQNPSGEIKNNMKLTAKNIKSNITINNIGTFTPGVSLPLSCKISPNTAAIRTEINSVTSSGKLFFSDPNSQFISSFPGDEDYLTDKFVRFAYRFKFEDGEYSLLSPFTQPAFIPKQQGYFVDNENPENDNPDIVRYCETNKIIESSILAFFENSVNRVEINIPTPFAVNQLANKLKIDEIDILYNESDSLAVKVLATIPVTDNSITSNSTNIYNYQYNSEKPFRTLPEADVVRVFDVSPIRAQSQSVSGNRVIYGNFLDKHTPPQNLDYNIRLSRKNFTVDKGSSYAEVAYPYHSVKQNRTYQVGIILSDRYGRSTDVVLSSFSPTQFSQNSNIYGGDTIYAPYFDLIRSQTTPIVKWFGDSLKVLFRSVIPNSVTYAEGYPGLYKSGNYIGTISGPVSNLNYVDLLDLDPNIQKGDVLVTDSSVHSITSIDSSNKRIFVQPNITMNSGNVNIYGPSNPLGFYSYKIVIKQSVPDYYNTYLGNVVQGEFLSARNSAGQDIGGNFRSTVSYTSLIGSNINKLPANTLGVQPEQTLFSTNDDKLFPRVNSTFDGVTGSEEKPTQQYTLGRRFSTGSIIGKLTDLGIRDDRSLEGPLKKDADLVNSITLQADPNGYNAAIDTEVPFTTTGSGVNAEFTIQTDGGSSNPPTGVVVKITVTKQGSGFKIGDTITFSGADFGGGVGGSDCVLVLRQADFGLQEAGLGFFQAQQNPTAIKFINPSFPIGAPARDPGQNKNDMLFNVFEVKAPKSNLEIFYETSTTGLISDLNTAILAGSTSTPVFAEPPVSELPQETQ